MPLRRVFFALAASSIGILLSPAIPASAHETGAIHLSANQVAIGGTLTVTGERLPKSSDLKLELRGVLDNFPAGSVKTDTAGAFQIPFTVPQAVPAGPYTLVVIASDGDVTARADLVVSAAGTQAAAPGAPGSMADMPGMGGMSGEHATAEPMSIARTTTTIEWVVIWGIIIVSLAGGVTLVRKSATTSHV
jgi:hypothetical protein